jgi:zinc protease
LYLTKLRQPIFIMKQIQIFLFTALFCSQALFGQMKTPQYNVDEIDIPYKKYVLPNGLRLIVHEDHKAPIVAVNIWYHVGSKNEKLGKSGFAHLFEHLMFNGSENYNKDYFQALEAIGATDLNGTTNEDRTNYFQNVPVNALDQVLWLESDRMGHLLGAIDQAKLDEQRGVVQNEKRQGENQPYAKGYDLVQKAMYPPHHPYGHTVIGEMEDLNAASVADVHEWFKAYYGAANAVLVIAGDVTQEVAYEKALKYFGNIPAGPVIARPGVNIPRNTGVRRIDYQDRVPETKLDIFWSVPQWGTDDVVYLDLVSDILASGKNSRLFKKLVYEKQVASAAYAYCGPSEIAGEFVVGARVKAGVSIETVEKTVDEVLAEFLANGPSQEELNRVRAAYFAGTLKGLERIGGFGGKSDLLAENEVYGGSADAYKKRLKVYANCTTKDLHDAAKRWLSDGRLTMVCTPFAEFKTSGVEADRSMMPALTAPVTAHFPKVEKATLSNGMKVILTQRKGSPSVVLNTMFDAGYSSDHYTKKPGLAALAMNMLDEGTKKRTSLVINEELQILGASLNSSSDLDHSYVSLSTLRPSLDQSLEIYADVLLNAAVPEEDLKRERAQQLSNIKNEKNRPQSMAMRVLPSLLYGEGHPYSMPMTGTGNEETVTNLTSTDIRSFYDTWLQPSNATVVVTGDISLAELTSKLEKQLGMWKGKAAPKKVVPTVAPDQVKRKIYVIDRPESIQSQIIAGYLTDAYGKNNEDALEQMSAVLGGDFTSRINMNIREDKHWSYGSRAFIMDTKAQRPFLVFAPVQTDKTMESVKEVMKEMNDFIGSKPMTQAEFDKTQQNTALAFAGMWETNAAVNGSVRQLVKYQLPDDYWQKQEAAVRALTLKDAHTVAKSVVKPDQMAWFIVGDKSKIAGPLAELGLEIIELDASGKVITKAKP